MISPLVEDVLAGLEWGPIGGARELGADIWASLFEDVLVRQVVGNTETLIRLINHPLNGRDD